MKRTYSVVIVFLAILFSSQDSSHSPVVTVGTLGGEFSVNASGAATYAIELDVPPGTNKAAPELNITYGSQLPAGLLGNGFVLTGISAINRCAASLRIDGYFGGIYFDGRDRFCLDGQRLIKIGGTGGYGAAGSVYHTQQETWTKVVAQGTCGSGPCSFIAWNKDGRKLEFGIDANSRVALPNKPEIAEWQIKRTTDLNGNTVEVQYQQDSANLQIYPFEINYTSNAVANLSAQRKVAFQYETRNDVISKYIGGFLFRQTQRLRSIRTYIENSQLVLTYDFLYQYSSGTGRSLLTSIQKCAADTTCYPATTFNWQTASNTVTSPNSSSSGQVQANWCKESGAQLGWIDFNADGLPDLYCDTPDGIHRVLLSTGQGLISPNSSADGTILTNWCKGTGFVVTWIDFNGDGKGDLACDGTDGSHRVMLSDGHTVKSPNSSPDGLVRSNWCVGTSAHASWGNFNADGRADLLCSQQNGTQQALISTSTSVTSPNSNADGIVQTGWCTEAGAFTFWADFNGDGLSDVHCSTPNGIQRVLLSTGSGLQSPNSDVQGTVKTNWCVGSDRHRGATDFNGDGLIDSYCYSNDGQHWVLLSTGTTLVSPNSNADGLVRSAWCAAPAIPGWGDFNGDGLADLMCSTPNGRQMVLLSDGANVRSPNSNADGEVKNSWCNTAGAAAMQADFNGDALEDFHCHDSAGSQYVMIHTKGFPDLLSRVTDGLGSTVTVTYAPLTDPGVYTAGGAEAYPILGVVTPLYVVSKEVTSDNRGGSYEFDYLYKAARTDLDARQWLGFEQVTTKEPATGRITETTYVQNYPVSGFVASSTTYNSNRAILARSEQTPLVLTSFPNVNQVVKSRETMSTYTNGVADYQNVKTFSYDSYGNTTLVTDTNTVDQSDAVFVCYKYANSEELWRLGYQRENKVTRTEQGCRDFLAAPTAVWNPSVDLRWNAVEFDAAMNPAAEKSWDDRNQVWLITRRTFDAAGNPVTLTDPAGYTTTTSYDASMSFPEEVISPLVSGNRILKIQYRYNPKFGVLESLTDPNGNEQDQILDGFGRVMEIKGPDPGASSGTATVSLKKVIYGRDNIGQYSEFRYRQTWSNADPATWFATRNYVDGMGRPFRQTSSSSGKAQIVTDLAYDTAGREWKKSYPRYDGDPVDWIVTTYDLLNRPTSVTLPDGTVEKTEYLKGELQIRVTEAWGTDQERTTVDFNDARDNLIQSISPDGASSTGKYDKLSQPEYVIRPNGARSDFEHDSLGRMVKNVDADTGANTWNFGPDGRMHSGTDGAGNVITYTYDSLGRITKRTIQSPGATAESFDFEYDNPAMVNGLGNVTAIRGPQYEELFSYSRYNLVATESLTLDGLTYLDGTEYDPAGRPVMRSFPDGSLERTSYYIDGLTQSIELKQPGQQDFVGYGAWSDYNALGEPGKLAYGNKLSKSFTYYPVPENLGRLHTWNVTRENGSSMMSSSYDWNRHNEITVIRQQHGTAPLQEKQYEHSKMGWLTRAAGPWGTSNYAYDPAGNITLKDGATFKYKNLTNLLESTTDGKTFVFDGAGNQTRKTGAGSDWTYRYNGDGRIKEILHNQQLMASHLYDDQGNRLKRVDNQGNISRYISEDFSSFESSGRILLTKNITNNGVPIAAITTETTQGTLKSALDAWRKRMAPTMYSSGPLPKLGRWLLEQSNDLAAWAARNALMLTMMLALFGAMIVPAAVLVLRLLARRRARGDLGKEARQRRFLLWWRTDYLRRHPFKSSLVLPLIAAILFSTSPTPAYGDLTPGQGYPTPGTLFFVGDQIDSTVLVTGPDGAETSQVEYHPYGEIDQARSSGPNNFRPKFTSKEWDDSSSLYYYGARYYDPQIARFLTPDPVDQFVSPYPYVDNDPVSMIDADGEQAEIIVAMIVIGAVTGAYFGGAAVNHESNPFLWDWSSGRTLAGIFAGAGIGAAGGAIGGLAAQAGVAAGIVGEILVGAGENAAYTALGGGSAKEIAEAAVMGAGFGALTGGLGAGLSRGLGSRLGNEAEELAKTGGAASRSSRMARREADVEEIELASFGPCSSFPAGTLIAGAQGLIPIQSVQSGSSVLGVTSNDSPAAEFAVTDTSTRMANRLVSLRVGNITLQATPEHPFWVPKKGWVRAADLQSGDEIQTAAGTTVAVESATAVDGPSQVYNFEVEGAHTYFVSPLRLLVHNPKWPKAKRCRLSELPPTKSQKSGKKAKLWQEKVEELASEFGDKDVQYFDPPKGRRELDLEEYAFVVKKEEAIVSLDSFGKGSTRPQHFSFADKEFGEQLGKSFDRSTPLKGQYKKAMKGTWHHHPWEKSMSFVPTELHEQLGHAGGFSKLFK